MPRDGMNGLLGSGEYSERERNAARARETLDGFLLVWCDAGDLRAEAGPDAVISAREIRPLDRESGWSGIFRRACESENPFECGPLVREGSSRAGNVVRFLLRLREAVSAERRADFDPVAFLAWLYYSPYRGHSYREMAAICSGLVPDHPISPKGLQSYCVDAFGWKSRPKTQSGDADKVSFDRKPSADAARKAQAIESLLRGGRSFRAFSWASPDIAAFVAARDFQERLLLLFRAYGLADTAEESLAFVEESRRNGMSSRTLCDVIRLLFEKLSEEFPDLAPVPFRPHPETLARMLRAREEIREAA